MSEFAREPVFDEDYLWFYEPLLTDERNELEADLVWRLLELEPGMEVLDVPCGHGRIANRLALSGAKVTGLDATPLFLERARADAKALGAEVEYVEGDMRELPDAWTGRFDAALCWFTSFGYFDDEANRRVLAEFLRVLKPGGRVVIETLNLYDLLPRYLEWTVHERDGNVMLDRHELDALTGRTRSERIAIRDGSTRRFEFFVRMLPYTELRDWLLAAGFASVEGYGSPDGEPLTAASRRMIALARR